MGARSRTSPPVNDTAIVDTGLENRVTTSSASATTAAAVSHASTGRRPRCPPSRPHPPRAPPGCQPGHPAAQVPPGPPALGISIAVGMHPRWVALPGSPGPRRPHPRHAPRGHRAARSRGPAADRQRGTVRVIGVDACIGELEDDEIPTAHRGGERIGLGSTTPGTGPSRWGPGACTPARRPDPGGRHCQACLRHTSPWIPPRRCAARHPSRSRCRSGLLREPLTGPATRAAADPADPKPTPTSVRDDA